MKLKIAKEVFNDKFLPYLNDLTPTQIFYGGASSGKSVFVTQRGVLDVLKGKRNYLVIRNVAATIASSTWVEWEKAINKFKLRRYFDLQLSNKMMVCKLNNKCIIFRGLDDPEKIKSITTLNGPITDIVCEEASEISEFAFNQLGLRMRGASDVVKRMHLLLNPIFKNHWIYRRFFDGHPLSFCIDDVLAVHSTHWDNRFLTDQDHLQIEAYKKTDQYYYNVYAKGLWGVLGALVFTNWEIKDFDTDALNEENDRHGLDFGFTNDPTAYLHMNYDKANETVYIFDELYERGLTNPNIAAKIIDKVGERYVACDSAEPKSIQELNDNGVSAVGVTKRRGFSRIGKVKSSILFGIQWLHSKKIIIKPTCQNMVNEISTYQWKKDKRGITINEPIGVNDHLISAMRYGLEDDMTGANNQLF